MSNWEFKQAAYGDEEGYNGWTNWHTWHAALMADNEEPTYRATRAMMDQGATPEQLKDYYTQHIIGPYNNQQLADAREWNEIPQHDRLDHNFERLKEDNPKAAEMVNAFGFGPDVSDTTPNLMDPEKVNWHEIHHNLNYENGMDSPRQPEAPLTFPPEWGQGTFAKTAGKRPHYNEWTGLPCHCPWGAKHSSRTARTAGDNLNRILKAPDKALNTPEGQAFKEHLQRLDPEYDPLTPFLAQRFKKGEIAVGHPFGRENQDPGLLTHRRLARGDPESRPTYPIHNFLPGWNQWFNARQHPTRRGVNVMDPNFSVHDMHDKVTEHQEALQRQELLKGGLQEGAPVHTFENGWQIRHLNPGDSQDEQGNWREHDPRTALEAEGQAMGHCIGSSSSPDYREEAENGNIHVYSLRDPKNWPHATWHYNDDGSLAEKFGPNDDALKPEYQAMLDEWGAKHNMPVGYPEGHRGAALDYYNVDPAYDMESYYNLHHPEGEAYEHAWEEAQNSGEDIDENTQYEFQQPDIRSIARDFHRRGDDDDLTRLHEAAESNRDLNEFDSEFNGLPLGANDMSHWRALREQPQTSIEFPHEARDVNSYMAMHHPDHPDMDDWAENPWGEGEYYGDENTQYHHAGEPDWHSIASDLHTEPDHRIDDVFETAAQHNPEHLRPLHQAVNAQPNESDEDQRVKDYWNSLYQQHTGEQAQQATEQSMRPGQQPQLWGAPSAQMPLESQDWSQHPNWTQAPLAADGSRYMGPSVGWVLPNDPYNSEGRSNPGTFSKASHPNFTTGEPCYCGFDYTKHFPVHTGSGAPQPPHYGPATSAKHCGSCKMYDQGHCWGYGNKEVAEDAVCDSWAPEKTGSHMAGKLDDFLMNPNHRPDLQTPEAQEFLGHLKRHYHNEKTDPLMPWLTREWKKGRITHEPLHAPEVYPGPNDPGYDRDTYNYLGREHPNLQWKDPQRASDLNPEGLRTQFHPDRLNHWADFYHSKDPERRGLGDIMQHDLSSYHGQVRDWETGMDVRRLRAQDAEAAKGGTVVHTQPDNWTVRQLHTPEELKNEGQSMGHCVGGYSDQVANGKSLIYSLRDPQGAPHATWEIEPQKRYSEPDPWDLEQAWQHHPAFPHGYAAPAPVPANAGQPEALMNAIRQYDQGPAHPRQQIENASAEPYIADAAGKMHREYYDNLVGMVGDNSIGQIWNQLHARHQNATKQALPPAPEGGHVVQIQGKSDRTPIPEYQNRIKNWFDTFPPEERPQWGDYDSYESLYSPDDIEDRHLLPSGVDEYGLTKPAPDVSWPSMLEGLKDDRVPGWANPTYEPATGERVYQLARNQGQIPQLAAAHQRFGEKEQENFDNWIDQNRDQMPPYDPEASDEANEPYYEAEGEMMGDHAGMQATNHLYQLLEPHYNQQTGEYTNEVRPSAQTTFSAWRPNQSCYPGDPWTSSSSPSSPSSGALSFGTPPPPSRRSEVNAAAHDGDGHVQCGQGHTHWGRYGAAGMLLDHTDPQGVKRYFLQHRSPHVMEGNTWGIPGGAMDSHETPETAAYRELAEEVGHPPGLTDIRHLHTMDHGGWQYHTVGATIPDTPEGPWEPSSEDGNHETVDTGWFTPAEISELPLHPGFKSSWGQLQDEGPAAGARPSLGRMIRQVIRSDSDSIYSHLRVGDLEHAFVGPTSVDDPASMSSGGVAGPQTQVLDHLSLSSVAHNLHHRFTQEGLDPAAAKDYAARLLKMIGYPTDDITIQAAIQAWQQLYPTDDILTQSPTAPIPEATTPTESWGYGTTSKEHGWTLTPSPAMMPFGGSVSTVTTTWRPSRGSSISMNSSMGMTSAGLRIVPWSQGQDGKFSITPEGAFHHWQTDDYGNPHHAQVAQELGLGTPAIDGEIAPTGMAWSSLDWPGHDHEALWQQAQLPAGVWRNPGGHLTKKMGEMLWGPGTHGTPQGQVPIVDAMVPAEDPRALLANFGVDQLRDAGQGQDSPWFFGTLAAEANGVRIPRFEVLDDMEHASILPDRRRLRKRVKQDSTVPSEVNAPDDHWPDWGERPEDERHHYDPQISNDTWP